MPLLPNKYKPIPKPHLTPVSIEKLLFVVWLYTLVLILYFADEIRLNLENSNHPMAKVTGSILLQASEIIPLSPIKNQINDTAQYLYSQEYRFGTNLESISLQTKEPSQERTEQVKDFVEMGPPYLPQKPKPKKLLLIGASSMHSRMGAEVSKGLKKIPDLIVQRHAKLGTGLARPDVYNWKEVTLELAQKYDSDLVIAQFIGNDCQSLILPDRSLEAQYGTEEWDKAYQQRIIDFITMLQKENIEVVLVGMPIVRSKRFQQKLKHVNDLVEKTALEHNTHFISLWEASTNEDGSFKEFIRKNGRTLPFRHDDGIHLSVEGSKQIADTILSELERMYHWKEKPTKD